MYLTRDSSRDERGVRGRRGGRARARAEERAEVTYFFQIRNIGIPNSCENREAVAPCGCVCCSWLPQTTTMPVCGHRAHAAVPQARFARKTTQRRNANGPQGAADPSKSARAVWARPASAEPHSRTRGSSRAAARSWLLRIGSPPPYPTHRQPHSTSINFTEAQSRQGLRLPTS